jgi:hypothetical protein
MEPESPSPYPQVPATCPYPEPTPSSPHDPLQLPDLACLHGEEKECLTLSFICMFIYTYRQFTFLQKDTGQILHMCYYSVAEEV